MKRTFVNTLLLWGLALLSVSCSDDAEDAILPGKWQGTSASVKFQPTGSPIAVFEETIPDFNAVIEIGDDGTIVVEDDGTITNGTWSYEDGKKAILANVDFQNEFLGTSQAFVIEQLTGNKLTLKFEENGDFDIPDLGDLSGLLSISFHFDRMN